MKQASDTIVAGLKWTVPVEHHAAALTALQALPVRPGMSGKRREDNDLWDELYAVSDWDADRDDQQGLYLTGLDAGPWRDRNLRALQALTPFTAEGSFVRLVTVNPADDPDLEYALEAYRVAGGWLWGEAGSVTWGSPQDFSGQIVSSRILVQHRRGGRRAE